MNLQELPIGTEATILHHFLVAEPGFLVMGNRSRDRNGVQTLQRINYPSSIRYKADLVR